MSIKQYRLNQVVEVFCAPHHPSLETRQALKEFGYGGAFIPPDSIFIKRLDGSVITIDRHIFNALYTEVTE